MLESWRSPPRRGMGVGRAKHTLVTKMETSGGLWVGDEPTGLAAGWEEAEKTQCMTKLRTSEPNNYKAKKKLPHQPHRSHTSTSGGDRLEGRRDRDDPVVRGALWMRLLRLTHALLTLELVFTGSEESEVQILLLLQDGALPRLQTLRSTIYGYCKPGTLSAKGMYITLKARPIIGPSNHGTTKMRVRRRDVVCEVVQVVPNPIRYR
ncbi:hypothetical protein B0H19DRAFT_1067618 [Mycena capillaripes]|nr:hypothetical protein B0H19DRAFT_1067618 [Mycena capillaripes]